MISKNHATEEYAKSRPKNPKFVCLRDKKVREEKEEQPAISHPVKWHPRSAIRIIPRLKCPRGRPHVQLLMKTCVLLCPSIFLWCTYNHTLLGIERVARSGEATSGLLHIPYHWLPHWLFVATTSLSLSPLTYHSHELYWHEVKQMQLQQIGEKLLTHLHHLCLHHVGAIGWDQSKQYCSQGAAYIHGRRLPTPVSCLCESTNAPINKAKTIWHISSPNRSSQSKIKPI